MEVFPRVLDPHSSVKYPRGVYIILAWGHLRQEEHPNEPIEIVKDVDNQTMTVTTAFDHPIGRVWELWSDPRKLERWWGPPGYPSTVTEHSLVSGGEVRYFMTGPEGERFFAGWSVLSVDPPNGFDVEDFFAHEDGSINEDLPGMHMEVRLIASDGGGTEVVTTSTWTSREAMQIVLDMGVEEGLRAAMGQMEAVVAEWVESSAQGAGS